MLTDILSETTIAMAESLGGEARIAIRRLDEAIAILVPLCPKIGPEARRNLQAFNVDHLCGLFGG